MSSNFSQPVTARPPLLEQFPFGKAPNNEQFNIHESVIKDLTIQQLMLERQIETLRKDFNFNMNVLYGEVKKLQEDFITLTKK